MTNKRQRSAVCAIIKDEVLDIASWVLHHINVGFNEVYIYDNISTDGTSEVLSCLALELHQFHYITWPDLDQRSCTPLSAYSDCVNRCSHLVDWLAVIDGDEYIIVDENKLINDYLSCIGCNVGAIAVSWLVFGSSGLLRGNGFPLIDYVNRATETNQINQHIKTIIRLEHFEVFINTHAIKTRGTYIKSNQDPVFWSKQVGFGHVDNSEIVHTPVRINHYFCRSKLDWVRRVNRGQLDYGTRGEPELLEHDRNEIRDVRGVEAGLAAKSRISKLLCHDLIENAKINFYARQSDLQLRTIGSSTRCTDAPQIDFAPGVSDYIYIDSFTADYICGWMITPHKGSRSDPRLYVNSAYVGHLDLLDHRPDVPGSGCSCNYLGFIVDLSSLRLQAGLHFLTIVRHSGEKYRILMGHEFRTQVGFSIRRGKQN